MLSLPHSQPAISCFLFQDRLLQSGLFQSRLHKSIYAKRTYQGLFAGQKIAAYTEASSLSSAFILAIILVTLS